MDNLLPALFTVILMEDKTHPLTFCSNPFIEVSKCRFVNPCWKIKSTEFV
jgi:hypothetical protein